MAPKELARLLSGRNEPSVLEKEAVFERIARRTVARSAKARGWGLTFGMVASAVGVLGAVWILRPRTQTSFGSREFESRGSVTSEPDVRLACIDETRDVPCALGRTLTFEVTHLPPGARYFASFARRSDGVILWYFPPADGRSTPVDTTQSVLSQAVRLGPPHTPGAYEVYAIFSESPRTRAEIKEAMGNDFAPKHGMLVIKRSILLRDGT